MMRTLTGDFKHTAATSTQHIKATSLYRVRTAVRLIVGRRFALVSHGPL